MKIADKSYMSHEKFNKFFRDLEDLGFTEKSPARIAREIMESGWVPFLKRKHLPEVVYTKDIDLTEIFVRASYVKSINDINEEDYVWIGARTKGNPIVWFLFPLLRTENFLETALEDVKMIIEHVQKCPYCPECNQKLYLVHHPEMMHMMVYVCHNTTFKHRHQNQRPYLVFDVPEVSDENALRLFNRYQRFYYGEYKRQLADPDKKPQSARVLRARRKEAALQKNAMKNNFYGDMRRYSDDVYNDGSHNDGEYYD